MPIPLSLIDILILHLSLFFEITVALTITLPFTSVNLIALDIRLIIICLIRSGSPKRYLGISILNKHINKIFLSIAFVA